MRYEVCIKYPSRYRYRKEIDAYCLDGAIAAAEKIRKIRGFGFKNYINSPDEKVCKIEYVKPKDQTTCPTCGRRLK